MTPTNPAAAGLPWRDVLLAVGCLGFGSVVLASGLPLSVRVGNLPAWSVPGWAHLLALAAVCGAQLFRTRAPVPALLAGFAVAAAELPVGLTLTVLLVLGDLLYCATLRGSAWTTRVIIGVVGTLIVAVVVGSAVSADDWRSVLLTTLQVATFPLVPVWWAMNVRAQRHIAEAERSRADQVARIAELDRRAAVAAERARMARDLHDVVAGHLSAIAIQSEAALSMVDGDPATTRRVLASVRENSVASLSEMRAMIGLLRSADDTDGTAGDAFTAPARLADLEPLLDSARAAGLAVTARLAVGPDLPVAVDLSAYRIVQEALTNAVKHAPGSRTEVCVSERDGRLVIVVTNDRSADRPPVVRGSGTGLVSMAERAQAVGGRLSAGPCDLGWRVRAELPVHGAHPGWVSRPYEPITQPGARR